MQNGFVESFNGSFRDECLFLSAVLEDGDRFTAMEGLHWDFKDQWPFSYSDSYFAGLCRHKAPLKCDQYPYDLNF